MTRTENLRPPSHSLVFCAKSQQQSSSSHLLHSFAQHQNDHHPFNSFIPLQRPGKRIIIFEKRASLSFPFPPFSLWHFNFHSSFVRTSGFIDVKSAVFFWGVFWWRKLMTFITSSRHIIIHLMLTMKKHTHARTHTKKKSCSTSLAHKSTLSPPHHRLFLHHPIRKESVKSFHQKYHAQCFSPRSPNRTNF